MADTLADIAQRNYESAKYQRGIDEAIELANRPAARKKLESEQARQNDQDHELIMFLVESMVMITGFMVLIFGICIVTSLLS